MKVQCVQWASHDLALSVHLHVPESSTEGVRAAASREIPPFVLMLVGSMECSIRRPIRIAQGVRVGFSSLHLMSRLVYIRLRRVSGEVIS